MGERTLAPILQRAAQYVDANMSRFLDELFILIRQPSVSATGEGVPQCAKLLGDMMRETGINTEIVEGKPYPFVCGSVQTQPHHKTLLVYGHYDVQPPEPLEAWKSPPYAPEIRDGRIYGRGSGDNKGQLFAHIKATEFWLREIGHPPINLKFVFEGGEESGSPGFEEFALSHRDQVAADACYAADGPMHESGRPTLFFGVRGMLYVRLTVRVSRRDAHSAYASVLPNAALELCHLVSKLIDSSGRVKVPGFYDGVRSPSQLEREAIARIPPVEDEVKREFGIKAIAGDPNVGYYEKLMFTPVMDLEAIHVGYLGVGHKAAVPSSAKAMLNIRMVADQDPDQIYRSLVRALEAVKGDYELTVEKIGSSPPSRTPLDHPAARPFIDATRAMDGDDPILLPSIGAGCHANHVLTRLLGIPTVWAAYAQPDEANHAPNENLRLDHFRRGILASVSVIDTFGRWQG